MSSCEKQQTAVNPVEQYVGQRIRLARKREKLTQSDMAERLNVSPQLIHKIEKADIHISVGRLSEIASILDLPIDFFVSDSGQKKLNNILLARCIKNMSAMDTKKLKFIEILTNSSDEDFEFLETIQKRLVVKSRF